MGWLDFLFKRGYKTAEDYLAAYSRETGDNVVEKAASLLGATQFDTKFEVTPRARAAFAILLVELIRAARTEANLEAGREWGLDDLLQNFPSEDWQRVCAERVAAVLGRDKLDGIRLYELLLRTLDEYKTRMEVIGQRSY